MRSAPLLVVLLALNTQAAPQVKPKPPDPSIEAARIEKLRAKYEAIRHSPDPADVAAFRYQERGLAILLERLDKLDQEPASDRTARLRNIVLAEIEWSPVWKDLYDIALHDGNRKAAEK
ncbi:MAG TPA: hypothetical protein VHR66_07575 [Gemmataceae bacterium]|nr:hypothetical protein [Gemmataceae bacterium]